MNSELKDIINESARIICRHYDVDIIKLHDIEKQANHPSIAGMKAIATQVATHLALKKK